MYARFFTKALADLGLLGFQEPFARLFTQGMVNRDGAKMSKSRGNTVSPRDYVERYGADATRAYILFVGHPAEGGEWSDEGFTGIARFLDRLYRAAVELPEGVGLQTDPGSEATALLRKAHWAIDKVTRDLGERFATHTSISAVMELVNEVHQSPGDPHGRFAIATAASLVFPFAPHLGAEVYELMTGRRVWEEPWPEADPALLASDTFQLVVQVNGKVRDRLEVPAEASKDEQERLARQSPKVAEHLDGGEVVKTVVVPGKLVNFVVR
jgi:leucyl-tRNA synthetase